jgi:hypothetical protein
MKHHWIRLSVLVALSSVVLYGQPQTVNGPSEQLHEFSPSVGAVLIKGTTVRVSATVTLFPSMTESVEYIGAITINGRRRRRDGPFDTVLTPSTPEGSETVNETLSWFAHVNGPKLMTVRLKLSGTGKSSQTAFTFGDMTTTYQVRCNSGTFILFRLLDRLLGRCM